MTARRIRTIRWARSNRRRCRAAARRTSGCGDGRSLYDALGDGFGLLRFDRGVPVDGLVAAAKQRGVPLSVLDIDDADAAELYAKKLVLVRPDRHVAWRANAAPDDALELIDHLRGARVASMAKVAAE